MSLNLVSIQIGTLNSRDICRCRHILKDCIQKLLHTFVSVSGTTAYRHCRTLTCSFSQSSLQFVNRRLLTFQILHHQIIIQLADLLDQFCTIQLCVVLHIIRNICNGNVIALIIIVDIRFHLEQVNDSLEIIFLADRKLQNDRILSKSCPDLLNSAVEVCTQDVHLVDERHTRYIVGISLTPYVL